MKFAMLPMPKPYSDRVRSAESIAMIDNLSGG